MIDNEALKRVYELQKRYLKHNKNLRKGQAFFNALHWVSPTTADKVRDTSVDPYYTDNIDACLSVILKESH